MASVSYAPLVSRVINELGIEDLLDYGAGKCRLMKNLKADHPIRIQCYDPAIPHLASPPIPSQMVACIDVLEHVEPVCLVAVLDDLVRTTLEVGFFSVHTGPAVKFLDDGRNAHLIQEGLEFWLPKFWERFNLQVFKVMPGGFFVIVHAR